MGLVLFNLSCSQSETLENGKESDQIDIYLTRIVVGQKSTNPIAQYMKVGAVFACAVYTQSEDCQHGFCFAFQRGGGREMISRHLQIFVPWGLAGMRSWVFSEDWFQGFQPPPPPPPFKL